MKTASPRAGSRKPVVIPQTTKAFKGVFYSPFIRAYPPGVAQYGLSQDVFLKFIDEFNEAFVAHPAFNLTATVGNIVGHAGQAFPPLSWAGHGLAAASKLTSAGVSYARSRSFVKHANAELFGPLGYRATVLTTEKMMAQIGHEERKLQLPPRESQKASLPPLPEINEDNVAYYAELEAKKESAASKTNGHVPDISTLNLNSSKADDPRLRRVQALEGYVEPLQLVESPPEEPDNWFKRWGARNAQKKEAKQTAKQLKRRAKMEKRARKAERRERKGDGRAAKIERKWDEKFADDEARMQATTDPRRKAELAETLDRDRCEMERELGEASAKHERKAGKKNAKREKKSNKVEKREQKAAQKIRWIVITVTGDSVLPEGDDVPLSSGEEDEYDSELEKERKNDTDDEDDSSDEDDSEELDEKSALHEKKAAAPPPPYTMR